ncbi:hypothetical protein [Agromyces larvae]|uniref:DUF4342 domain-containing protein n=1 Tax=Agromyces larvae TaxID=2929802 RepID=A0ABY4C1U6_9MICO|nr:hypothetical protein [Agromyces larvae]UOE45456.1 hypothetical protein MTO99_06785 [Agromyces larvae]
MGEASNNVTRPSHPALAKVFDQAIQSGLEVRYADEQQVVVFRKNQWGCGGIIFLIILGLLTAFIVPLVLLILGAFAPGGQVITYTLKPNGKLKKKTRAAS